MLFHNAISFFQMGINSLLIKPITKILTTLFESLYCQECSNDSESNGISIIDIVVGDDHSQGKIISLCKFKSRDMNLINIDSYTIKNADIDCEKYAYEVLNDSIIKLLNEEINIIINEDMFV